MHQSGSSSSELAPDPMTMCHGLSVHIRLVLLEQVLKDDKPEKAFKSAVHTKFPYIKADGLLKGKYMLSDTAVSGLVAQFPTEEVKEDYKAKVKERQCDHHVAWNCSECDHLNWMGAPPWPGRSATRTSSGSGYATMVEDHSTIHSRWLSKHVRAPFQPPPDKTRTPPNLSALGEEELH